MDQKYCAGLLEKNLNSLDNQLLQKLETDESTAKRAKMSCKFCLKSGLKNHNNHNLKDTLLKVTCPVLRGLVCRYCGQTGDFAHTLKYCPKLLKEIKENKISKFANL